MARIYLARATGIGAFERHVVLKMILPERAHDATSVNMFLDEARLAASLNHQNVAQVFEVGEEGGIHFLAMEYVHGQDLRAMLAKAGSDGTRLPLELALTVVAGAAAGLHHAHERRTNDGSPMGIVHRDVSPSNIMIGYDGAVKLLDFGIAKAAERSVQTQSGIIKGKFAYMAPEQCRGREVDRRSDVFSLGIILYEVTTQHRCFRADSDFDTMHRIVTGDIVKPTRLVLNYPPGLEAIVMKALAVDAAHRFQSAGQLLEAMESFAVASRMPLSTMALGRFMRDMFGNVEEPWLNGRFDEPAAPPPREHTISNTNASGDHVRRPPSAPAVRPSSPALRPPSAPPVRPSSPGLRHEDAPMHLPPGLELEGPSAGEWQRPAGDLEGPSGGSMASWSVRPHPLASALPPLYSPSATPPPELHDPRPLGSQPLAPLTGSASGPSYSAHPSQTPHGPYAAAANASQSSYPSTHASASMPSYPSQHSSPSIPSIAANPVIASIPTPVAALPSIPSMNPMVPPSNPSHPAYPSFQPHVAPASGAYHVDPAQPYPLASDALYRQEAGASMPELEAASGSRSIYVWFAVALVGIIVLLVLLIRGNADEAPATGAVPPTTKSEPATPPVVAPPAIEHAAAVDAGVDAPPKPARVEAINLKITTSPPGSDVVLNGKPIGTTPLDTHIKRATGFATLTVHKAHFEDVTTTIDLSGDYRREIVLQPIAETPVPTPTPPPKTTPRPTPANAGERPTPKTTPKATPRKCQSPDAINPFDDTPVCAH